MKICSLCGELKESSEFYERRDTKSGFQSRCKECTKNTAKLAYKEDPNKKRNKQLKKRYGITLEQYNKRFQDQLGCCAICGKHQTEYSKVLSVDHCHKTGKVRKLLCINCNSALGKLQEDVEILQKAISYLKEHNE